MLVLVHLIAFDTSLVIYFRSMIPIVVTKKHIAVHVTILASSLLLFSRQGRISRDGANEYQTVGVVTCLARSVPPISRDTKICRKKVMGRMTTTSHTDQR